MDCTEGQICECRSHAIIRRKLREQTGWDYAGNRRETLFDLRRVIRRWDTIEEAAGLIGRQDRVDEVMRKAQEASVNANFRACQLAATLTSCLAHQRMRLTLPLATSLSGTIVTWRTCPRHR